jgi:hypothetical protein
MLTYTDGKARARRGELGEGEAGAWGQLAGRRSGAAAAGKGYRGAASWRAAERRGGGGGRQ